MQTRRIAVVGGAGYIGSHLCRLLMSQGAFVECIDAFWFGEESIRELHGHPRFHATSCDLRWASGLDSILRGCAAVVHLAGLVGDGACNIDPNLTRSCNYDATVELAERSQRLGVERLVFASSCSVYGCVTSEGEGAHEDGETAPLSLYARDKLACEAALEAMASERFHPTSLRFATVFGWSPRMRFDLVANLFTARAVAGEVIRVFGGTQWRPLVHIDDVARAITTVLAAPLRQTSQRAFNVGSAKNNMRILDLAQLVSQVVPGAHVEGVSDAQDPRDYRVDFRRIAQELGFQPQWRIEDGIREIASQLTQDPIADIGDARYVNEKTTRRIWQEEQAAREEVSCK